MDYWINMECRNKAAIAAFTARVRSDRNTMERWNDGEMERWRDGVMERWSYDGSTSDLA